MVVRDKARTCRPQGHAHRIQQTAARRHKPARRGAAAQDRPKEQTFVTIASEEVPALVADQGDTAICHGEQEMLRRSTVRV